MGGLSIWHWVVVLAVVLLLFGGGGKLSRLAGDLAKGINAFKKNIKDTDDSPTASGEAPKTIDAEAKPAESVKRDEAAKG